MNAIRPVVLCGGAGTRLWPLSRKALPKQFAPLLDGKSLLQLTLERLRLLNDEVTCVAAEEHRFLVQEAIDAAGVAGQQILEPVARNTAAAMAIAALNSTVDQLLLFAPADHHIPDAGRFAVTVQSAVPAALAGHIVTFGVVPAFPSTAYGYIRQGQPIASDATGAANQVDAFVEKPVAADAARLVLAGDHFWNAGIFLVKAGVLLA
ncbi:MAG: mannose-1-phosphate guanylyltransferase/mannose-6-phosphate isomerase, partial [Comamonadaceae bacterium]